MAFTIKKTGDIELPRRVVHKIADVPGGVTVKHEGLLLDGTPLTAPATIGSVANLVAPITWGVAYVDKDSTELHILKGHGFKVGDFIAPNADVVPQKINTITGVAAGTTTPAYDKVTLAGDVGSIKAGDALYINPTTAPKQVGVVSANAGAEVYICVKAGHSLKVGSVFASAGKGTPITVTKVELLDGGTSEPDGGTSEYDGTFKITFATALTEDTKLEFTAGTPLYEATADNDGKAVLTGYFAGLSAKPQTIVGTTIVAEGNVWVDALTHAVVRMNYPELIAKELKGIVTI